MTESSAETEFARETITLMTREMLLTADPDMAVVRIFGSDKSGNAVRIGLSPERALRIGAAFIRAGLAIRPALRAELVDGGKEAELPRLLSGDTP
jgi:hypothetical protein